MKVKHGGLGTRSSHIHIPFQGPLGIIFLASGILLLLKSLGTDYVPFIPESVYVFICGTGSIIGGFYLLITVIWRPRIYL